MDVSSQAIAAPPSRAAATLIGFGAVLLWSLLAVFTALSGKVPPFQLAAMTFLLGGALGAATWPFRRGAARALRQPLEVWALGVGGLLIVLLSALLPNERLRIHHLIGALLGLAGTALLFSGGRGLVLAADYLPGLAAAFVAAFVWASYSVLSRRFASVPTDAVAGFCLATAVLAAAFHLAFETAVWPQDAVQWTAPREGAPLPGQDGEEYSLQCRRLSRTVFYIVPGRMA